jgi:hypothetical protein
MPNPKRPIIQQKAIRRTGGNVYLKDSMKASEQVRL